MSALLQDVVAPEPRAVAVAVSLIVAHLLGDAFSPALVGGLSDASGNPSRCLDTLTVRSGAMAARMYYEG